MKNKILEYVVSLVLPKVLEVVIKILEEVTQIDLNNRTFSGLKKTRKTLSKIEEVSVLEFENTDIVRNKIVSKILEIFPDK